VWARCWGGEALKKGTAGGGIMHVGGEFNSAGGESGLRGKTIVQGGNGEAKSRRGSLCLGGGPSWPVPPGSAVENGLCVGGEGGRSTNRWDFGTRRLGPGKSQEGSYAAHEFVSQYSIGV